MAEGILEGIIVQGLDAHGVPFHLGSGLRAFLGGGGAQVIGFGALDHAVKDVGGGGGVLGV